MSEENNKVMSEEEVIALHETKRKEAVKDMNKVKIKMVFCLIAVSILSYFSYCSIDVLFSSTKDMINYTYFIKMFILFVLLLGAMAGTFFSFVDYKIRKMVLNQEFKQTPVNRNEEKAQ